MKRLLPHIFSLLISWQAFAQIDSVMVADTSAMDTTAILPEEPPTIVSTSLLFDYGKAALSAAGFEDKYEGGLTFTFFDHYYIAGEYGVANLQPENALQNGNYSSEGSYFRVGGGYQVPIDAKNNLAFGVRYAQSKFTDQGEIFQESEIQENYSKSFGPRKSEARWIEMVISSEGRLTPRKSNPENKINHLFYLGFHIRLRFMSSYDRYPLYDTYAVPGYGRTVNNPAPAVNLYLKFKPF